jgi:periplasmic copper chaperone A
MHRKVVSFVAGIATVALPLVATAHVSLISGPGFANTTQEITFGVGHGCAGADTYKIKLDLPTGVTSVRAMRSDFGKVAFQKDTAGVITSIIWQKPDVELLDEDFGYYKLVVRMRVPNQPFTTVYFPAQQTCRAPDGTLSVVNWSMLPTDPVADGGADEPASELRIVPPRQPGWNKFVVPQPITDLKVFFGDARIVWKGSAAFSPSATTTELINATPGVTALSSLAANDEIWVKY